MPVATVDILWTGTMCANNQRPFGVEVIWEDGDRLIVLVDDGQVWQVNRGVVKRDTVAMATNEKITKAMKLVAPGVRQQIAETALDRLLEQTQKVVDLRYATGNMPNDGNTNAQLEVLSVLLAHFEADRLAWAESVLHTHGKK